MLPYRGVDGSSPEELEEERRLAYVAITRARRKLIVSHAAQRTLFGYTRYMLPSRFLRDLPAEVTESVSLAAGRGSFGSGPNRYGASGPVSGYRAAPAQRFGPAPTVRDEFDQRNEWEAPPAQAQSKPLGSGRHVEYDADAAPRAAQVHKGSRVHHQRFGQGTVLDVVNGDQPRVLARFAGWGERRVLLSALRVE
jgi:DNA helicase-2/ATP-dependent DNA helicase PcrA